MIISASRRTDIPSYYSDWFFNRLKEGFVYVRNPMNIHQVSKIPLRDDVVDGIVLWTKNPLPMMEHLKELASYPYYFQFTVTLYQADVEVNLPSKKDGVIPTFQRLADIIGPERIVWRYDPIVLNEKYSAEYHTKYFEKIAERLKNHTHKCTISFIDHYRNTARNVKGLKLKHLERKDKDSLGKSLSEIAHSYGLAMSACAEDLDLSEYGISQARCIDDKLLEKIAGYALKVPRDKSQRLLCGCRKSIDIGRYNTCLSGCKYCYANYNSKTVETNASKHDPKSPLIIGQIDEASDKITERPASSDKISLNFQKTLF